MLTLEPLRLRHFYLCDKHRTKFEHLEKLRGTYPARDIQLFFGDFNAVVHDVLKPLRQSAKRKHLSACLTSVRSSASVQKRIKDDLLSVQPFRELDPVQSSQREFRGRPQNHLAAPEASYSSLE